MIKRVNANLQKGCCFILKLHKLKGSPIKISFDFTQTPGLNICPSRKSINCFLVVISDLLKKICNNDTVYFIKIVSTKTNYHLINLMLIVLRIQKGIRIYL